ncbi:MAG: DUF364 domain-containing protein [Deltaproteobacteria bacterium]|nr:DUF364 domain-containing protein [Deltaproteobacteria bacterium]
MDILQELLDSVKIDLPVTAGVIGSHLIAVASRRLGLAARLPKGEDEQPVLSKKASYTLVGRSARDLARWLKGDDWLRAGIGMAAVNSLLEIDYDKLHEINAKHLIAHRAAGKNLMVVGHFPFVHVVRPTVRNLWIMEKQPGAECISEDEGYQLMPEADVVAITGSSLINHTFERIMVNCRSGSFKIMLGPSTPLSPVLFDYGLDAIGGALVEDSKTVLTMVEEGASFRQLTGVRTVIMSKDSLAV